MLVFTHLVLLYNSDHVFVQSLEDSGRLWGSVLHGYARRRHLPGGQRLSERSLGEFTYDTNKEHVCFFRIYSCLVLQGLAHRLRGSANAVRIRAPQIGGEAVIQPSCSGAGPKVVACYLVICRELRHLGRTLLHYRLWLSSPEEERGPVELHNKWCSDRGHSGCTQ